MHSPGINPPGPRSFPWRLLLLSALLACVVAAVLYRRDVAPPQAMLEMPRERLVLRAGKLCLDGSVAPFTGWMTERYATSQLKSRSAVSNGMLEGLSVGWHTNGVRQVEEWFHTNVSHGLRSKWHDNGRKLSAAPIVTGKIEGVFRRWHDNGQLAEEITMKADLPDGASRAYFPSGCLKSKVILQAGKVIEQHFWKDGEHPPAALLSTNELTAGINREPTDDPKHSRPSP